MSRRWMATAGVVFVLSRVALAWIAGHPESYGAPGIVPASDVGYYHNWADQLLTQDRRAYSEVPIEYPPGSLPFMGLPEIGNPDENAYRTRFIVMLGLLDATAFLALLLLARRWRSGVGAWFWIAAGPLLGPTIYLRLDLIPAVATLWAVERASTRDWTASGGFLGFGTIAKLYPGLLAPAGLIVAAPRRWFAIGFVVVVAALTLPFATNLGDLASSVLGYHAQRGIQVESIWGAVLFVARRLGYTDPFVTFNFGALHFEGGIAPTLDTVSNVASILAAAAGAWLATRVDRDDPRGLAEVWFASLALILAVGSVFSPQFMIWLFALAAPVLCIEGTRLRFPALALLPVAAATQLLFPFLYGEMLAGVFGPMMLLVLRNLAVLWIGLGAAYTVAQARRVSAPSIPEPASG